MNKLILFPYFLFIINTINAQEGKKEYLQKVLNKNLQAITTYQKPGNREIRSPCLNTVN